MNQKRQDRLFADVAVQLRLVTPKQLKECAETLAEIREKHPGVSLAEVLVERLAEEKAESGS